MSLSVQFKLKSGKICKIMITHVCFILLTLAGSLRQCLYTQPNDLEIPIFTNGNNQPVQIDETYDF